MISQESTCTSQPSMSAEGGPVNDTIVYSYRPSDDNHKYINSTTNKPARIRTENSRTRTEEQAASVAQARKHSIIYPNRKPTNICCSTTFPGEAARSLSAGIVVVPIPSRQSYAKTKKHQGTDWTLVPSNQESTRWNLAAPTST